MATIEQIKKVAKEIIPVRYAMDLFSGTFRLVPPIRVKLRGDEEIFYADMFDETGCPTIHLVVGRWWILENFDILS